MESTAESTISNMTEMDLVEMHQLYSIGPGFQLEVPLKKDRACNPPSGRICLYEECFRAGLRLPLHPFIINLLTHLGLAPGALVPNSWRHICGFFAACVMAEVEPSVRLFQYLFNIRRLSGSGAHTWWYVAFRGNRNVQPLIKGIPTSIHGWKTRFFFVSRSNGDAFSFPAWGSLREAANRDLSLDKVLKNAVEALKSFPTSQINDLLSEEALYNVGLCPNRSQGAVKPSSTSKLAKKKGQKRKIKEVGDKGARTRLETSYTPSPTPQTLALPAPASERVQGDKSDTLPLAQVLAPPTRPSKKQRLEERQKRKVVIASSSSSSEMNSAVRALFEPEILALPDIPVTAPVVTPMEATPSEATPLQDKGKGIIAETSGTCGPGLPLEASALHDYKVAQDLFSNVLLPADANEVLEKPLKDLRVDALTNFIRMAHHMNGLFERTLDLKKSADEWEARAGTLLSSRNQARDEVLEAKQEAERLQGQIDEGEGIYKNSQIVNATLNHQVDTLTSANKALEAARIISEGRIAELQSSLETAQTERARLIQELGEVRAIAVADFRSSKDFEKEKLEFSLPAFEEGVKFAQKKLSERYPDLDLSFLFEGEDSEEDEAAVQASDEAPPPA